MSKQGIISTMQNTPLVINVEEQSQVIEQYRIHATMITSWFPQQRRPSPQRRKLWSIYLHFQTFHPPFSLPLVSHHSPPAGPSPTEGVEFRILFYQKFLKLDFLNHYCFLAAKKPSKYDHDQMITDHIYSDMFWKLYCTSDVIIDGILFMQMWYFWPTFITF